MAGPGDADHDDRAHGPGGREGQPRAEPGGIPGDNLIGPGGRRPAVRTYGVRAALLQPWATTALPPSWPGTETSPIAARTPGTAASRAASAELTRARSPSRISGRADLLLPGHDRGGGGVALNGRVRAQDGLKLHAPGHREHGRGEQGDQRAGERAVAAPGAESGETQHRSAPQAREARGDVVGGWRLERAGDPAVGEQQDAVGVCRCHRIVGDHHHRVPVLVDDLAEQGEHLVPGGCPALRSARRRTSPPAG